MDRNELSALQKARQDYWELVQHQQAFNAEQNRKPQPPTDTSANIVAIAIAAPFACWWGLLIGGILGLGSGSGGAGFLWGAILAWVLIVVVTGSKESKKKAAYNKQLNEVFPQELRQWQWCMNQKQEALYQSEERYKDSQNTCAGILAPKYLDANYEYSGAHPVVAITQYIEDGRADTIKEALNLYEADEREARRDGANAAHRERVERYAFQQARAAERQAQEAERLVEAQKDANKIAKRRASAAEGAAKSASEAAETLKDIKTQNLYK